MKVVLTQHVETVGDKGEIKEVKPGFARNYLVPRELAILVSDPRAKILVAELEVQKKRQEEKAWQAAEKANQVEGKEIVIQVKVGERQQLFAAVGKEEIIKAIKEKLSIEPEKVEGVPLKKLGEHTVTLDFGADKQAQVIIKLTAEKTTKTIKETTVKSAKKKS